MSTTIAVDPTVLTDLAAYYRDQSAASVAARDYLDAHCQLNGDIGLLLVMLERKYNSARITCMDAFAQVTDLTAHVADEVVAHRDYMLAHERDTTRTVDQLHTEVTNAGNGSTGGGSDLGSSGHASGGGSGRSSGTSPGGATYRGGNGDVRAAASSAAAASSTGSSASTEAAPSADAAAPAGGATSADVAGQAGSAAPAHGAAPTDGGSPDRTALTGNHALTGKGNVEVVGDANVVNAGDGVQIVVGDGATATVTVVQQGADLDTLLDLLEHRGAATAAQQAADAAGYHRIWEELAAHDPLGRSADQLSAAWEAREPVSLDAGAAAEIGSSAATALPTDLVGTLLTPTRIAAAVGSTTSGVAA